MRRFKIQPFSANIAFGEDIQPDELSLDDRKVYDILRKIQCPLEASMFYLYDYETKWTKYEKHVRYHFDP